MKIRQLLAIAVSATAAASASAFNWEPAIQQPNPNIDVTQAWQIETLRINAAYNLSTTDVMPIWIDEEGNEIVAKSSSSDPTWGQYNYDFNLADFKSNGDYILKLPEGLLKNAAGELSDPKEIPYTVLLPQFASGMFSDFEVLSVSPDLNEPQGFWNDQKVIVNTNHNDAIGMVTLTVKDNQTGISYINSSNFNDVAPRELGNASPIEWEVANSYKFYNDRTYTAEFVFFNGKNDHDQDGYETPVVARKSYEFKGKIESYKYSSIKLEEVTPVKSLTISEPNQAVFTFTFSGPVNIYKVISPRGNAGDPVSYPASSITSNEDKTVWTVNLSDNDYVNSIDAQLTLRVYARDLDGNQLHGNDGEEDQSCFEYDWQCDLGAKPIEIVTPENGASIESLTEIVVKAVSGEDMTWSWNGEAYVTTKQDRAIIGFLNLQDSDPTSGTEFHFTKWSNGTPINMTAEGDYAIYFGPGCFNFGEQFDEAKSKSLYSLFSITGNGDTPDDPSIDPAEQETLEYTSVDPENGSVVTSIDELKIYFAEDVMLNGCDVVVYNDRQERVGVGMGDVDWETQQFDYVIIKLNEPITEPGRYMVSIPARSIGSDNYEEGKTGICIPAINLFYTIEEGEGPDQPGIDPAEQETLNYKTVVPANDSKVTSIESIRLTFPEPVSFDGGEFTVYDANNVEVAKGQCDYDYEDWDAIDVILANLSTPITEDGVYTIVIPARTVISNGYEVGKAGSCSPEIKLTYTIGNGTVSVDAVDAASEVNVYDINGRVILKNATAADVKALDKGIYIINGKKVVK